MVHAVREQIEELRTGMNGPIVLPGDSEYDARRQVFNAEIDRRPSAIARCTSTSDVVAAINFARDHDLEISVRGGAHSMAGTAVCDDGLMIDLSLLNEINVDVPAQRAHVSGGALLGSVDAATQAHGLAAPFGLVSHTGVGGLTLGGGMGWLTRKFGLSVDNLLAAEVVTADGQVLQATDHPDLLWAIRGGGGNFGIATSFDFQLHEVNPMVHFGMFFWGLDQGPAALRLARDIVEAMPPDVNAVFGGLNAPPAPFVPEQHRLAPGYVLMLTGFGSEQEHAQIVDQIRMRLQPLFELVTPMQYVQLQQLLDEGFAFGSYGYEKGTYVEDVTDDVIKVVTEHVPMRKSPLSAMLFYRLDAEFSRVSEDETAFSGGRSPRYAIFTIGYAPEPELLRADREWVRNVWDALRPYAIGGGDGYLNGTADYKNDRVRGSYGDAKYERLAKIKGKYDPENVFHNNANIQPS